MKTSMICVLVAVSYLMTGCGNITEHQLGDGFFIRTTAPVLENSGGTRKLYYQSPSGAQKVVWKYVADPVLVHNRTAIFIGSWQDTDKIKGYAYFAAKENGPIININKTVLTRAAQKNRAQPEEYIKRYETGKLDAKGDLVEMQFLCGIGTDTPDLFVDLSWDEISEIVDTMVKTGKPHKDKLNGITYWE